MEKCFGYDSTTKKWETYEDFFHSFCAEVPEFKDREKAFNHLTTSTTVIREIATIQELQFIVRMKETHYKKSHGYSAGESCNRYGCFGTIYSKADDMSCNCHNTSPCAKCTAGTYCTECDWDSDEDN